ncbi:ABC transporter substrate-binding protein [Chloroflexota bacterium]
MKRLVYLGISIILLSLLVSIVAGCQQQFSPGTFTDDLGRQVTIEKAPERIVSHVPGLTEILFALGLEERIVGVSDFCDYPQAAKLKDKIGGFFNPSIERIVELTPDLVVTNGSVESLMTQLDALGITYMVLKPEDIEGILKNIQLVGKATGTEKRAIEVVKDMQDRMLRVSTKVNDTPGVRVFYTFATTDLNNPWTAGPGSFVDSLIGMAGGENIGAKALAPWVQFSIEEVASSDPEVILVDASHGSVVIPMAQLKQHPHWRGISAVKQGRVYPIDGDLVNRPGPRIVLGLEEMVKVIHPELFGQAP